MALNKEMRRMIVEMTVAAGEGHIPSAFSILDIVTFLYENVLKFDPAKPDDPERDYFVLSKGHGCQALYVNLYKHGFITKTDIDNFCTREGILGEHPDMTKVPGAEASTGSLGHGLSFSVGIALGHKIKKMANMIYVLIGDGESHEGTIWEAAHFAANFGLTNLCVVVDWNRSGMQLLPIDDIPAKWAAFGWNVQIIDGHDEAEMQSAFDQVKMNVAGKPNVIVAQTIKGKGVPVMEGHGIWHHRTPNNKEYQMIMGVLK